MTSASPVAFYDADCGFCSQTVKVVAHWGLAARFEPLQSADLATWGIDRVRALEEMAFVDDRGEASFGHHAWAGLLRTGNPVFWLAGTLLDAPLIEPVASLVYRTIATHRDKLPGGTPACRVDERTNRPAQR